MTIISYRKVPDAYTLHDARLPAGSTELATLAGVTYAHVPAGAAIPEQPGPVRIQAAQMTAALRAEIRAASPHPIAAQRQADAAVAAGTMTAEQGAAAVQARLAELELVLTDLADLKIERIAAIKEERDRRILNAGYRVGQHWFHSDLVSRSQQIGLVIMGANLPAGLQWKTMGGAFVTMTPQLAGQVFQAAAASDSTLHAVAEAAIQADTEPNAVVWPPAFWDA